MWRKDRKKSLWKRGRITEIFLLSGGAETGLADKFRVFDERFVGDRIFLVEAFIHQVAQMVRMILNEAAEVVGESFPE